MLEYTYTFKNREKVRRWWKFKKLYISCTQTHSDKVHELVFDRLVWMASLGQGQKIVLSFSLTTQNSYEKESRKSKKGKEHSNSMKGHLLLSQLVIDD